MLPRFAAISAFGLLTSAITANAQLTPEQRRVMQAEAHNVDFTPACVRNSFCLDCGTPRAGLLNSTPDQLLHDGLAKEALQKLTGKMIINILVDTTGHACCDRVQNYTSASAKKIRALSIPELIAKTSWTPAVMQNGRKAVSAIFIMVKFSAPGIFTADYFRTDFTPAKP